MKSNFSITALSLLLFASHMSTLAQTYDPQLREQYGADDYGMKSYTFVMLKTGPSQLDAGVVRDSLFAGHMANIGRLAENGDLVLAGPLGKNGHGHRGIFILNTTNMDSARAMLAHDAAIAAGLLDYDLYPWYGSAALPAYLEVAKKITKEKP